MADKPEWFILRERDRALRERQDDIGVAVRAVLDEVNATIASEQAGARFHDISCLKHGDRAAQAHCDFMDAMARLAEKHDDHP